MSKTFLIADTHFGQESMCQFVRKDGSPVRPWNNAEEMDEALITNWNSVVSPKDRVYILGDLVMARKNIKIMERLQGRFKLIAGNHDIFAAKDYLVYFDDIKGYHVLDGMILSHIPIHPSNVYRFGCNIHGHLHTNRVMLNETEIDPRYFCVSVEQINYTPIEFEEVKAKIIEQGGMVGFRNLKEQK
jgi:calcineurin-like phosphoesterase family protein